MSLANNKNYVVDFWWAAKRTTLYVAFSVGTWVCVRKLDQIRESINVFKNVAKQVRITTVHFCTVLTQCTRIQYCIA